MKTTTSNSAKGVKREGKAEGYRFYWYNLKAVERKNLNTSYG